MKKIIFLISACFFTAAAFAQETLTIKLDPSSSPKCTGGVSVKFFDGADMVGFIHRHKQEINNSNNSIEYSFARRGPETIKVKFNNLNASHSPQVIQRVYSESQTVNVLLSVEGQRGPVDKIGRWEPRPLIYCKLSIK